jgi:hypothetical protein
MSPQMKYNNNNDINFTHIIDSLKDYMFYPSFFIQNSQIESNIENSQTESNIKNSQTESNIESNIIIYNNKFIPKSVSVPEESIILLKKPKLTIAQISTSNNSFFTPKETDTLFWCFYIIKNGFSQYEYPGNTSFVNEKNDKFKCIEDMRNKKDLLKSQKIKKIKEDIEDELANKNKIGLKTFLALCITYNINIIYIHKRKYYQLINDPTSPIHVIHCIESPNNNIKYSYELNITNDKIEYYKNNFFFMENIEKPLNAISYYKLSELKEIYNKLNLNANDCPKNKKDIYESIILNI